MTVVFLFTDRKCILEEYCEISSLLTEEIVKVHQEISASVQQIDPLAEYQHFIDAYRSRPPSVTRTFSVAVVTTPLVTPSSRRSPETPEPNVEFDTTLLEETDNLPANEILWNTLTADNLQTM